jgi:Divergent InlB B-repeat domain
MPGKTASSAVSYVALGLLLSGVLLLASPSVAGILDATWTAPTTNTDGSLLTDLASYLLYYGTSTSPCPGSSSVQVAAPTSSPGPNQTTSFRLTGLSAGTLYNVAVTAVDAPGNQSACSSVASAVARTDFVVSPTGTVNFGNVNVGSFVDQVFTVSNTGGGTVSGSATVAAPFSIVSGSPFTLVGAGATQAVTVRFTPTTTVVASTNISFTADGDTLSSLVTGTGVSSAALLTVFQAGAGIGTVTSNPAGISCGATCSASFANGSLVSLTAAPAAGSTFNGWSGGCTGTGPCSLTTNAATAVTATFMQQSFPLTLSTAGAGTITSSPAGINCGTTCSTSFTTGTVVTLTAAPAAGSTFTSWSGGGCSGAGSCTLTLTAATAVAATFTLQTLGVTAPVISGMSLAVTSSGATIGWTTNTPSDTQIEYGLTASYGNLAPLNATLVTAHSQAINGLAANAWYHFRMRSRDAAGNLTVSGDVRFKTRPH